MPPKIALALSASALVVLVGGPANAAPLPQSAPAVAAAPAAAKKKPVMNAKERKVLALTNKARAKAGCKPLKANAKLARAARKHSKDMVVKNYFSHTSKDGRSPWDRIKAEGYKYPGAENIAAGYPTAAAVVKGWMNSKGHRANILNCKLKALGVGHHKKYWTQDFGWK
ncbi:CAP domain-containing protein [Actinocorallia sp. A-T 12471]|uniref:CAP domain-containing protein n=1 Tax=Actinocorallia sp. A-T 12471 TaxID=3089813 RepID=UPI0029D11F0E|nr:CAP domain-containing protein [Actinocorallia sp. A-T 12471]MDX6739792.1 CAP domain-containing protein [Actinocorallia sp. A-T 12471]